MVGAAVVVDVLVVVDVVVGPGQAVWLFKVPAPPATNQ